MSDYSPNRDAEGIAVQLIPEYHLCLQEAKIVYLFQEKPIRRGGRECAAVARKPSKLMQHFSGADFVIIFSKPHWFGMTAAQQKAVVDHELCHCDVEVDDQGEQKWVLRSHDIEEFNDIIKRHGAYSPDLKETVMTIKQLDLFEQDNKTPIIRRVQREAVA